MANRAAIVKQADLTRMVAGVVKAGVPVGKITIAADGTVTIIPAGMVDDETANPCDRLLK